MKSIALALTLLLALPACSTFDVGQGQRAMEPYTFAIEGQADGLIAANARFIAVDAEVTLTVKFRKYADVLWEQTFQRGSGQRAYEIIFNENDEFVQMREVSWEVAQTSMNWLPPVDVVPEE